METKIVRVNAIEPEQTIIEEAGRIMKSGGLVAFPTETVYGLGGDALHAASAEKIYWAKGRPCDNPLIIHIAEWEKLKEIAAVIPDKAKRLAKEFWPGPLTMIFHKQDGVPIQTTGGLDSVAVRMPVHPVALALIRQAGGFVAAPSANTSGRPSPTKAAHVAEDMTGRIDMILDGGMVDIGLESTIVDMTGDVPIILRPGYITPEMIESAIGSVKVDRGLLRESDGRPRAPGMKYRHYAPKAVLTIIEGDTDKVAEKINELCRDYKSRHKKTGVMATEETKGKYQADVVKSIGSRADEESIALHLFSTLREFDESDVAYIFSESFYTPQMGQAIMNRLLKAAGHRVVAV